MKFCFFLGMFYWLRMFESFAFYITMITETVSDILEFTLLFAWLICGFSSAILVLNDYQIDSEQDNTLVASSFGWEYIDLFLN